MHAENNLNEEQKEKKISEIISSYELRDMIEEKKEPEIVAKSNLPTVDKLTQGFVPGELIVISGPTKNGKTLFAQTLTVEFDKQALYPLWFSYELAPKYFLRSFDSLPLFYVPTELKGNDLKWVIARMIQAQDTFHTRVVFIDHLHYLLELSKISNASLQIGAVVRYLKRIATKRGLIIFLLCHTTKVDFEEKLSQKSIRDSSFVAQESDTVLLIQRNTKEPASKEAKLIVETSRRVGTIHEEVPLIKTGYYLRELEEEL